MFDSPILIYGQTGFPVRPKSWPDIGQLSGQSDIRPNSTFFYFQKQGCQIFILKIPFFMFQLNHIHSVWPRAREFSRVSGRIWRKWILWKKWKFLEKVGNPVTTQQWPNLFSNRFSYPRHAYIPNFNMIGQKIVPKIEKKFFFIIWAGLPTLYSENTFLHVSCQSYPFSVAQGQKIQQNWWQNLKKMKFWKKLWKKLATLSWYIKPTGTNLAQKLVFTAKACLNSKFHMFRSENVPKEAKKSFSSVYKAGMPTIYSYFPFFPYSRLIICFQCGMGPEKRL